MGTIVLLLLISGPHRLRARQATMGTIVLLLLIGGPHRLRARRATMGTSVLLLLLGGPHRLHVGRATIFKQALRWGTSCNKLIDSQEFLALPHELSH